MKLTPAEVWFSCQPVIVNDETEIDKIRQIQADALKFAVSLIDDHGDMARGQILNQANQLHPLPEPKPQWEQNNASVGGYIP